MKEIRWHARAGQGAKTAAQLLAIALLREGKSVQAFPEYGPERRGSPMRAYTRYDDRPIRRHDSSRSRTRSSSSSRRSRRSPTSRRDARGAFSRQLGAAAPGSAVRPGRSRSAGQLREPRDARCARGRPRRAVELDRLAEAAVEVLGRKTDAAALHAALDGGYAAVKEQRWAA